MHRHTQEYTYTCTETDICTHSDRAEKYTEETDTQSPTHAYR